MWTEGSINSLFLRKATKIVFCYHGTGEGKESSTKIMNYAKFHILLSVDTSIWKYLYKKHFIHTFSVFKIIRATKCFTLTGTDGESIFCFNHSIHPGRSSHYNYTDMGCLFRQDWHSTSSLETSTHVYEAMKTVVINAPFNCWLRTSGLIMFVWQTSVPYFYNRCNIIGVIYILSFGNL